LAWLERVVKTVMSIRRQIFHEALFFSHTFTPSSARMSLPRERQLLHGKDGQLLGWCDRDIHPGATIGGFPSTMPPSRHGETSIIGENVTSSKASLWRRERGEGSIHHGNNVTIGAHAVLETSTSGTTPIGADWWS
jgi:hypothetical protein